MHLAWPWPGLANSAGRHTVVASWRRIDGLVNWGGCCDSPGGKEEVQRCVSSDGLDGRQRMNTMPIEVRVMWLREAIEAQNLLRGQAFPVFGRPGAAKKLVVSSRRPCQYPQQLSFTGHDIGQETSHLDLPCLVALCQSEKTNPGLQAGPLVLTASQSHFWHASRKT